MVKSSKQSIPLEIAWQVVVASASLVINAVLHYSTENWKMKWDGKIDKAFVVQGY